MASILSVGQLKGLSSGDTPNTITLPTGQTLDFSAGTLTMPAGHVLQVVQGSTNTSTLVSGTTSYTDTTLTASITPSSTNSKILITINQHFYQDRNADGTAIKLKLLRDSTTIFENDSSFWTMESGSIAQAKLGGYGSITYLDSPSTTSAITYKTQGASTTTANSAFVRFQHLSEYSFITLMEIAG